MARLFGTDGVRGIANTELTCDLAFRLGQASAYVLASDVHRPTILVGRDTRISGEMLESALVAGICSVGARAVLVEVLPTPAIAYLTRFYEADAGAVISASHNTVEYNGIKFFDKNGYKLPDAVEDKIEEIVLGHPKNMDGTVGPRAEKCETLAKELEERTGLHVVLWDERRTTVAAHEILHRSGKKEKKHRQSVDAVAATLILQGYLDFKRRQ